MGGRGGLRGSGGCESGTRVVRVERLDWRLLGLSFRRVDGGALGLISKDGWLLVHDQQGSDVLADAGVAVAERLKPTHIGPSIRCDLNGGFQGTKAVRT